MNQKPKKFMEKREKLAGKGKQGTVEFTEVVELIRMKFEEDNIKFNKAINHWTNYRRTTE